MEKEKYFNVFKNYKKRASNLISDISSYDSWSDEFCRKEAKELYSELIKYFKGIDFTQFTLDELKSFDFSMWDDNLILMPSWAIDCLSEGTILNSINGTEIIVSDDKELDKDTRFGVTAYGFNMSQLRDKKIKEILE
jgi:hypothetical protein